MITEEKLKEIYDIISKAERPLYLFDDDPDGLTSFLIFWRKFQKGKGISVKGYVNTQLLSKVKLENPDLIVILDKPVVDEEFVIGTNIKILHLDHHPPNNIVSNNYKYFNPRIIDPNDERPVSYWSYKIIKQDQWLATIGCISDWFIPEFAENFQKEYPKLLPKITTPGEIIFKTPFGQLCKTYNFCLKGKSQDVKRCINVLTRIESPEEIINQTTSRGKFIFKYFEKLEKQYRTVINPILEQKSPGKFLIYTYSSLENSFTSLISNEISVKRPKKVIILGRISKDKVIMSIRSNELIIPPVLKESIEGLNNATGGGHNHACGSVILQEDFNTFITKFKKLALIQMKNNKTKSPKTHPNVI